MAASSISAPTVTSSSPKESRRRAARRSACRRALHRSPGLSVAQPAALLGDRPGVSRALRSRLRRLRGALAMAIHMRRIDELALITLDRPEALNALSFALLQDLSRQQIGRASCRGR